MWLVCLCWHGEGLRDAFAHDALGGSTLIRHETERNRLNSYVQSVGLSGTRRDQLTFSRSPEWIKLPHEPLETDIRDGKRVRRGPAMTEEE